MRANCSSTQTATDGDDYDDDDDDGAAAPPPTKGTGGTHKDDVDDDDDEDDDDDDGSGTACFLAVKTLSARENWACKDAVRMRKLGMTTLQLRPTTSTHKLSKLRLQGRGVACENAWPLPTG